MKRDFKLNILVTGGAGYIGSHVVKQLIEYTNHNIIIIDNLSTGHQVTIDKLYEILGDNAQKLKFIKADLSKFDIIDGIFKDNTFDAIIHFAASIVVPESVENPIKYYMNNTVNTTNLIKMANKYNIKKIIFSSTAAVYGESTTNIITENIDLSPINPYGWSKRMSEQVIQDTAAANIDLKYIIFRYFNVAGADIQNRIGQSFPNATHLIKVASQTALGTREKMAIYGDTYNTPDGTCIRDYIHIDDLAFAHIMALEYLEDNNSNIFNVGYGKGYSVSEVINTMKKVSGVNFKVHNEPKRAGDPAILISDNKKLNEAWDNINNSKLKEKRSKLFEYNDLELICKTALDWERKLNEDLS
ncbi:MAG: UDP-glucose 4-epimerase GalE [Sulfurovum sp.]|nr:UDP-glucose 4-epimerase GalE [Sulfurovaceae bacterium]